MWGANLSNLWALLLMIGGGVFLWWLASRVAARQDARYLGNMVAVTVALRTAWSYVQHNPLGAYYHLFGADTRYRFGEAVELAQMWREGLWVPQLPTSLGESHNLLIGLKTVLLVYIFGPSPMLSEAFTITLNASICIAVYLICRHIGATSGAARVAVAVNALLPSLIFWSTQDLKDPVLAACGVWALLCVLKVSRDVRQPGYLALLVVSDALALTYRPYVGILFMIGQACALVSIVPLPMDALGRLIRTSLFILLAPLAVYVGLQGLQDTYGSDMNLEYANDQFNAFREDAVSTGLQGSEYEIPLTASTPAIALLQLPIRVLLLLLTPIPLFPGTPVRMMMFPEMWFVYLWVVPRFGFGVREVWVKHRSALVTILLSVAPLIAAYALKTSVSGEAARMRTQFLPQLLILAGIGHVVWQRERRQRQALRQEHLRWLRNKQKGLAVGPPASRV